MKRIILSIITILFPLSEDQIRIAQHTEDSFRKKYQSQYRNHVGILSSFKDNDIRAAVHLNKFHAHTHAAILLASLLDQYIASLPSADYFIIPIPLGSKRQKQRGHNQVESILQKSKMMGPHISIRTDLLVRTVNTLPQTSLTRKDRLKNLKGAFILNANFKMDITKTHIVLIDDVVTTGSTLKEAKSILLPLKPASITCIAIAG